MISDDADSLKGTDLEDGRPVQPLHDHATLVDRLCGKYVIPVNDGCGLLDGKDTFTREFPSSPINREAAARIRSLEAALREIVREERQNNAGQSIVVHGRSAQAIALAALTPI